ncbi:hypothetical protein QJQ58_28855 [Paenibacillus dendritiformis]|uniref:hypothetical protein n=1 Tax=Paenibacillus dendritiformis TaxID=130049 RepID=UPI00248BB2DF|nr:hypothetical protein [Paenibacillus dendritiformis]WGU94450.1 hypothetical protein QJQ58_28855 [Paenibacillus dendritiformis]
MLQHIENLYFLQKIDWSNLNENRLKEVEMEFTKTVKNIELELALCDEPIVLKEIIERNEEHDFMPINLMFLVYQQLTRLLDDKISNLRDFSNYLLLYGPDWQEEADQIILAVDNGEIEKAVQIALEVDYDKYQH